MPVLARDIARFLKAELRGPDLRIQAPQPLDQLEDGCLVFVTAFSEETRRRLNQQGQVLALVPPDFAGCLDCSHIIVDNPRLAFAQVLQECFAPRSAPGIAATARLGKDVLLGQDVTIGEYCVIGDHVRIGRRTVLAHHVVIAPGTRIGSDCKIKSHSVIGEEGFGFAFDAGGRPIRIPHLGTVEIGDHVEIGSSNSIARSTLGRTVLGNYVKTDDQVHIAHNVRIGDNTIITACAEISGSTVIGKGAWIGPNASVIEKVVIGDDTLVGIGAVVTKEVGANAVVAGNPAVRLRTRYPVAS